MFRYRSLLYMGILILGAFGLYACSPIAPSFDKRAFLKSNQNQAEPDSVHPPKDINVVDGPLVASENKPIPESAEKESSKAGIRPSILIKNDLKGFEDILDEAIDLVVLDESAIQAFKKEKKTDLALDWAFTPRAVALVLNVETSALEDLPIKDYSVRLVRVRDGVWTLSESEGVESTLSYLVRDKLEAIRLATGQDELNRAQKELHYHRSIQASDLDPVESNTDDKALGLSVR